MNWILVVACLSALFLSVRSSYYTRRVSYNDESVLRCWRKNAKIEMLMERPGMDVWNIRKDGYVDIRMSKENAELVMEYLPEYCRVLIDDVEDHVQIAEQNMIGDKQDEVTSQEGIDEFTTDNSWFQKYHDLKSIVNWYKKLAEKYSKVVRFVPSIGKKTPENREMIAVHITASTNPNRHRIYMQCQIHAREWISGAACMYQAKMLAEGYDSDDKVKSLLDKLEFVIVPVVNPDGYEYTWKGNRLWRKNRRKFEDSTCVGVDLNRNYNMLWEKGTDNKCTETYHGSKPASEIEVQNAVNYFKKNKPIVAALDIHSFSELLLRPWGWTKINANDEKTMEELGREMSLQMYKVHKVKYTSEKSIDLYPAYGVAGDWFYSQEAANGNNGYRPISYTIELRDKGNDGFLLRKEEILPTSEELWAGVKYLAEYVSKKPIAYYGAVGNSNYNGGGEFYDDFE